jgi:hypothetical protein
VAQRRSAIDQVIFSERFEPVDAIRAQQRVVVLRARTEAEAERGQA